MPVVVTREDYFAAAMTVLAGEGFSALKIGRLCKAVGVTTGSFYHYFGSWDGFVTELLEYWEREQTARILHLATVPDDPAERVATLKELALTLPHEAEAAIRAWSNTNPTIADFQRRVDGERLEALRQVVAGVVSDAKTAEYLAFVGITLLVGLQQWRTPVRRAELVRVLDTYEELIAAHSPALRA